MNWLKKNWYKLLGGIFVAFCLAYYFVILPKQKFEYQKYKDFQQKFEPTGSNRVDNSNFGWPDIMKCVSFDRRGTNSVITEQIFGRCCSDEFAENTLILPKHIMVFILETNNGLIKEIEKIIEGFGVAVEVIKGESDLRRAITHKNSGLKIYIVKVPNREEMAKNLKDIYAKASSAVRIGFNLA